MTSFNPQRASQAIPTAKLTNRACKPDMFQPPTGIPGHSDEVVYQTGDCLTLFQTPPGFAGHPDSAELSLLPKVNTFQPPTGLPGHSDVDIELHPLFENPTFQPPTGFAGHSDCCPYNTASEAKKASLLRGSLKNGHFRGEKGGLKVPWNATEASSSAMRGSLLGTSVTDTCAKLNNSSKPIGSN